MIAQAVVFKCPMLSKRYAFIVNHLRFVSPYVLKHEEIFSTGKTPNARIRR